MDLADLLAREGYAEPHLPALVAWARGRADALVATLADDAPLRALLAGASVDLDMSSRPVAVRPAPVEDGAPIDLRRAVTAATAPHPVAPVEDVESGLGGFARFGGMVRMNRPYPYREREEPAEERPTLVRSFALAAEKEAEEREEPRPATVPPPPGELTGMLPQAALGISAEESGGLVVGIPDDDAGDVPVPRASSASAAHRRNTGTFTISPVVVDDDDRDASAMIRGLTLDSTEASAAPPPAAPVAAPVEQAKVDLSKPVVASQDAPAPVLRQRSGKKKVVELGAPVARVNKPGSKGTATVVPRSGPAPQASGRRPPPPPPGGRRPTPADDDIQELSRVEMIDDLPAYLRDDEG